MKPIKPDCCETCGRSIELSFHHLIPKKVHNKPTIQKLHAEKSLDHYGIWMCKDCHKKIHRLYDHKTLAEEYYTLKRLKSSAEFRKFIAWVRKQKKRVK